MEDLILLSTASRVLNQNKQRYTTCEKELLATVYSLQRFRIYIYRRKVTLFRDNKALKQRNSESHKAIL